MKRAPGEAAEAAVEVPMKRALGEAAEAVGVVGRREEIPKEFTDFEFLTFGLFSSFRLFASLRSLLPPPIAHYLVGFLARLWTLKSKV